MRAAAPGNAVLLATFLVHYFYRDLVFPLRLRGGKPTPLVVWGMALGFCVFNGYMQTRCAQSPGSCEGAEHRAPGPAITNAICVITSPCNLCMHAGTCWTRPPGMQPSRRACWRVLRSGRWAGPSTSTPTTSSSTCGSPGRRVSLAGGCLEALCRGGQRLWSAWGRCGLTPALPACPCPPCAGYKIPRGGLFELVSAANYFGEIVEWSGWALASASLPAAAFALFTFANLAPRGWRHHVWYRQRFPRYPRHRRAVIPFLW